MAVSARWFGAVSLVIASLQDLLSGHVSNSEMRWRTVTTLIKQRRLKLLRHVAWANQAEDHNHALKHLSTRLVTGDCWEDALVRPGYQLSVTILNRLSNTSLLSVPFVRTSFGARSFSVAAAKIWNSLPPSLHTCTSPDTFRRHLKTHYCQQALQSTSPLSSAPQVRLLLTIVRVY